MKLNDIISKARTCKKSVESNQKLGVDTTMAYYFAKVIISAKDVKDIKISKASKSNGDYISRQIGKSDYVDMCKRMIKYVETNHQLPNFIKYKSYKIKVNDYTYAFARIVVYAKDKGMLPLNVNVSSKSFTAPVETSQQVYDYFVKTFGNFGDTIDGALKKINAKGYGYYYDDKLSNKEVIDGLAHKSGDRPNCTDVCQMLVNILKILIKKGKYRKVDVLHVKCSGGDGHVRLAIVLKDGTTIYRDGACTVADNGKGATCNWCTSNFKLLAINPTWFMNNLNR